MSRIRIVHRTGYTYGTLGAKASFNEVRMTPLSSHEQLVMSNKVEISPTAWQHDYVDYWGTHVLAFEVHERHHRLRITASSEVDVHRSSEPHQAVLGWDDLSDPNLTDQLCEYLECAPYTTIGDELLARVAALRAGAANPTEFVNAVWALVRNEMHHVWGAGRPKPTAAEAWQQRSGVCQDLAHLVIGALRSQGVPARYVAGYVLPIFGPELGQPQLSSLHAWVQFWDGSWVGLDPISDGVPGEGHIEVGYGRDYADVMPLFGIFTGGRTSELFVEVELTKVT